jgi:hypothetical protein
MNILMMKKSVFFVVLQVMGHVQKVLMGNISMGVAQINVFIAEVPAQDRVQKVPMVNMKNSYHCKP